MALGLGSDPRFSRWGDRKPWSNGSAAFGPGVFDDLVAGVAEFLESHPSPAALGCIYLLTNREFAHLLATFDALCIVLDKGASMAAAAELEESNRRFPIDALAQLGGMVTELGGQEVGPMRLAGVRGVDRNRPLLHAKLLVLGNLIEQHFETPVGEYSEWRFEEERVWIGSANWTYLTKDHLEIGLWIDDRQLVTYATEFLSDLISFSEPFGSTAILPTPELQAYEPDPEMLREYFDEYNEYNENDF
jgi:hypothetical protein